MQLTQQTRIKIVIAVIFTVVWAVTGGFDIGSGISISPGDWEDGGGALSVWAAFIFALFAREIFKWIRNGKDRHDLARQQCECRFFDLAQGPNKNPRVTIRCDWLGEHGELKT